MEISDIDVVSVYDDSRRRSRALAALAGGSAAAFGLVTLASATRASAKIDRALAPRLAARAHSKFRKRADAIAPAGKWYVFVPLGVATSAYVYAAHDGQLDRRPRLAGAAVIAASGVIAAVLEQVFDKVLPQPPIPPGRNNPRQHVYPSGHAFVASAVSLTSAYVLSREKLIDPRAASALAALIPAVNSGAKLAARKHWPSDVLAGLLAGLTVATACAAVYEYSRRAPDVFIVD